MIGRLLLEWKTQQALEHKKKNKQYTNEEIFQDKQMVYLLAPHLSALQTDTTKFKQDSIGPLFIDTALDKTHYRLKDATGLLLPELKDLKSQINKTNKQLASQYRMMSSAHNRYDSLFRQTYEMQMIHHFALLLF